MNNHYRGEPTKYYYTDPVSAWWMAKHFKVGFCPDVAIDRRVERSFDRVMTTETFELCIMQTQHQSIPLDRIYVAGPFADVFVPQAGDLVEWSNGSGVIGFFGGCGHGQFGDVRRIIQRNGVAFHWPEVLP